MIKKNNQNQYNNNGDLNIFLEEEYQAMEKENRFDEAESLPIKEENYNTNEKY